MIFSFKLNINMLTHATYRLAPIEMRTGNCTSVTTMDILKRVSCPSNYKMTSNNIQHNIYYYIIQVTAVSDKGSAS